MNPRTKLLEVPKLTSLKDPSKLSSCTMDLWDAVVPGSEVTLSWPLLTAAMESLPLPFPSELAPADMLPVEMSMMSDESCLILTMMITTSPMMPASCFWRNLSSTLCRFFPDFLSILIFNGFSNFLVLPPLNCQAAPSTSPPELPLSFPDGELPPKVDPCPQPWDKWPFPMFPMKTALTLTDLVTFLAMSWFALEKAAKTLAKEIPVDLWPIMESMLVLFPGVMDVPAHLILEFMLRLMPSLAGLTAALNKSLLSKLLKRSFSLIYHLKDFLRHKINNKKAIPRTALPYGAVAVKNWEKQLKSYRRSAENWEQQQTSQKFHQKSSRTHFLWKSGLFQMHFGHNFS